MIYTIFLLPESYFASTTAFIFSLTTDLKALIVLGFGVSLAFYVLPKVINLIKHAIK